MSDQCLAIFRNPQNFGLNSSEFSNLNFEEFAKNKVGGGYKKKKVKKETKKKETKKKETKKKETKKKDSKKKVTKKKETKKKVTKKGGGVLGDYVRNTSQ